MRTGHCGALGAIVAGTSYARCRARVVNATDEHGTNTPLTNAHVSGRVRAYYNPIIAVGAPDED
jgi:hypothetical protein